MTPEQEGTMIDFQLKQLERAYNAKTATACYYALRDITQEINVIMQHLYSSDIKTPKDIEKALADFPREDAQIIRRLLDTHARNLKALAERLPGSGYPAEWSESMKDLYDHKLAKQYKAEHETILGRYLEYL